MTRLRGFLICAETNRIEELPEKGILMRIAVSAGTCPNPIRDLAVRPDTG